MDDFSLTCISLDAIRAIAISTPTGEIIPLSEVANVDYGMGANVVNRQNFRV